MNLIEKKIDELIEIATSENDINVLIVLLALRGSMISGNEGLLASGVQDIIKIILLPKVQEDLFNEKYKN